MPLRTLLLPRRASTRMPDRTSIPVLALAFALLAAAADSATSVAAEPRSGAEESVYARDVAFALDELEAKCGRFFELKSIDWRRVRAEFAKEAQEVRDESEHLWLLIRLVARVRDGHARVVPLERGRRVDLPESVDTAERVGPGMAWCRIGKRIWVKHAWSSARDAGVEVGSQVLAVDGEPVDEWLDARVEELRDSAGFSTDHHAYAYAMHGGLAMPRGSTLELELKLPRGKRSKKTVTYSGTDSGRHQGPIAFPEGVEGDGELTWGEDPARLRLRAPSKVSERPARADGSRAGGGRRCAGHHSRLPR